MKKRNILIYLIIILLFPTFVSAESMKTDITPINVTITENQKELNLKDIAFYKNELGEFGLTGQIINNIPFTITADLLITYYGEDNTALYTQIISNQIEPSATKELDITNNINNIAELTDINNISYYSIEINKTINALKNHNYLISKYNIDIKVKDNNTYEVTEEITVDYKDKNKPFIKTIPINNKENYYKINVSKIKVDSNYSFRKTKDKYIIEIDGYAQANSQKTYKITYEYNYGKDTKTEYDELYYILNGIDNDTVISNLKFNIEMPFEFDKSKLEIMLISDEKITSNNIVYSINKKNITGAYLSELYPNENIKILSELPENYFINAKKPNAFNVLVMIVVPTFSTFLAFMIWLIYGKDNKYAIKKSTTPPDKLNSLEIGYLFKGKANEMDVASLILHFANKGYLKIEEDKSDFALIKSFELHKLKNYDGSNNKERIIFDSIFANSDIVTPQDLDINFYNSYKNVKNDLNDVENTDRIFENTTNQKLITILFMVLSLFMIIFVPSIEYGSLNETVTSIFLLSLCVIVYTGIYSYTPIKIFRYIILLIAVFHIISYVPTMPVSFAITNDLSYLLAFLYGALCVILLIIFIIIMPKRTVYGNKMLAKINGFKNYLINITPQEIDKRLKDNPNYFYDILPYTFVLGISNVWIKKFENAKMSKPEWTSIKPFHFSSFSTFITHAIHTLEKNMRNN